MTDDFTKSQSRPLTELKLGESAVIDGLSEHRGAISNRLLDIGFTSGCTVECVGESPLGGMRAYLVRGTVTALRHNDASTILCRSKA